MIINVPESQKNMLRRKRLKGQLSGLLRNSLETLLT